MEYHVYWLLKGSCFQIFGDWKYDLFSSQKVDGKMKVTEYWKVLVLNFSKMEYIVFFEPKSWWKDDIYQLLESSCFELFGDGKYGLFSAKKLMERWYLLGLFELSMILQDLGNMVFCAVYEYLTREDLGHKRSIFEKTKFEYSPLGMSLSKAFSG